MAAGVTSLSAAGGAIHTQERLLLVFTKAPVSDRGNVGYKEKLE